jgi:hypothetical protein
MFSLISVLYLVNLFYLQIIGLIFLVINYFKLF